MLHFVLWDNKHVLCLFRSTLEETIRHIFMLNHIWERLQTKFQDDIILLPFMPQTAILGRAINGANDSYNLLGHILLIFKYYIYISREKHIQNYRYSIFQFNEAKEKREPYKTKAQKSAKKVNYRYHYTSDLMVHCEKDSGRVERGLFVSLFVYF